VFNSAAVTPFLSDGTSGNDLLGTTTVTVGALSAGATGLNITQGADAANTLTLGTTNLSAGNALNIGGTMYTLQTGAPTAAGQVQLGSTANATLQNIANAVNGADGVNSVNANVTAGTVDGGTGALTFNATANGAAGDLLSATSGSVTGTWGATTGTMTGGAAATYDSLTEAMTALPAAGNTVVVGGQTYQFETTVTNAGDVLIGGSTSATLQNLAAAIDAPAGGAATANYRAAAAAPTVSANAVGSTVTFTANASGVSGLTLTTTGTAFGGAALTGVALAGGAVAATAKGTLTLSSNLVAGSTLTVGSQTYTLVNGTTATAGQIALGATPSTANTNAAIVKAVNGTDGVNSVNADAVASLAAGVLTFTATTAGAVGNTYAATGGLIAANTSVGSWSSTGGTLTGGDGPTVTANLDTVANAQAALVTVTNAINTVAETRGSLGAVINQLTAASNVMNGQVQNLTSAQSGIMDANIGTTVANMSKYNTLQQTGIAALQQANQASQSILKLLQ
jgi:flagellin